MTKQDFQTSVSELEPQAVYVLAFKDTPVDLWNKIRNKEEAEKNSDYEIIDVRDEADFDEHHIPNSINVPFDSVDEFLSNNNQLKSLKGVVFVCRRGNTSRMACYKAESLGLKAINLKGGFTEWGSLNLPVISAN